MVCQFPGHYPLVPRFFSAFWCLLVVESLLLPTAFPVQGGDEDPNFQAVFNQAADLVVVVLCGGNGNDSWTSQGSGFILPGTNRVITAAHVIETADTIRVITHTGQRLDARLMYRNTDRDLAALEILREAIRHEQKPVRFVWSTDGLEGSEIAAISSPKGLDFSITRGIVSSVSRAYRGQPALQAQLEAAPGSSGGPVFLKDGRFLGLIVGRIPDQPWFSVIIPAPVILEFLASARTASAGDSGLAEEEGALMSADSASESDIQALQWYNTGVAATDPMRKIECYRKAVAIRDTFYEAWFNLGTALHAAGQEEEAVKAYQKALTLQPGARPVIRNLGRVLLNLNQTEAAVSVFQQAISPNAPAEVYNDLGVALTRAGRHDAAEAAFREAVSRNPDYAPAQYNLAVCLVRRKQFDKAAQTFERYLKADPEAADTETVRQWIETLRGQPRSELTQ